MPWHLSSDAQGCDGWAVIKDSDGSIAGCHKTKAAAQAQMAALYANEKGRAMGESDGDREVRVLGLDVLEIRHSGRKDEAFTVRGYAAVYDQESHDLGGFREVLAPGAFDEVLATDPDVHFVWDHDTRYVGARTKNHTLHLTSDETGLFIDAQVGNYSWAKDLRTALERGDVNQGSFAFTVPQGGDEFAADDDGKVTRTIRTIDALYDVTVTAQGAYPQTSLAAARSLAAVEGRPEGEATLVAEQGEPESQEGSEEQVEPDPRIEALRRRQEMRREKVTDLKARLEKLT